MSKYLKAKIMRSLRETYDNVDLSCEDTRQELIKEGIDSLKSGVPNIDVERKYIETEKPEHQPRYVGTDLAEVAIDVYNNNIKKKDEKTLENRTGARTQYGAEPYVTPARRHEIAAIARSLAGMRNGGDAGRLRQDAGPNGGDMRVGPGHLIHTEEKSVSDMSVEEYQLYLEKKDDSYLETDMKKRQSNNEKARKDMDKVKGQKNPHFESVQIVESPVDELEEELLKMEDHSWQSIDKVMRQICKEHDITPKQLHKDFKSQHDGMIPDEWAKSQVVSEECGWFPLEEALIHKNGLIYEVSMIWRGQSRRVKFFWPEMRMPRRSQMESAADLFYPGSRLMAFYPSHEDNEKEMLVLVPPMTEHFVFVDKDDWLYMSEEDSSTYEMICEEEGEPLGAPSLIEEGVYELMISDHETGEERVVYFGEWAAAAAKAAGPILKSLGGAAAKGAGKAALGALKGNKSGGGTSSSKNYGSEKISNTQVAASYEPEGDFIDEDMSGMSQKSGDKRSTESGAGMTAAGVKKYNSRTGGNLKTAVTTPPSKLKKGSKAAGRRKSFCARSKSWNGERGKAARKRWNC